jgi:hypothetical protein
MVDNIFYLFFETDDECIVVGGFLFFVRRQIICVINVDTNEKRWLDLWHILRLPFFSIEEVSFVYEQSLWIDGNSIKEVILCFTNDKVIRRSRRLWNIYQQIRMNSHEKVPRSFRMSVSSIERRLNSVADWLWPTFLFAIVSKRYRA